MKNIVKFLLLIAVCIVIIVSFPAKMAFGANPGPDAATCVISVTVDSIIEWEGASFANIDIDAQEDSISAQGDTREGSAVYTLWTNCNVALSANNTVSGPAELTDGNDILITKYKLSTDGNGSDFTGATPTAITNSSSDTWTEYDSFLATALQVTHINTDGAAEVTLNVEASNDPVGHKEVADSGAYTATQTITATWVSDD